MSKIPFLKMHGLGNDFVVLDGGVLDIAWREDGHVVMTGPVALSFEGVFDPNRLAGR